MTNTTPLDWKSATSFGYGWRDACGLETDPSIYWSVIVVKSLNFSGFVISVLSKDLVFVAGFHILLHAKNGPIAR